MEVAGHYYREECLNSFRPEHGYEYQQKCYSDSLDRSLSKRDESDSYSSPNSSTQELPSPISVGNRASSCDYATGNYLSETDPVLIPDNELLPPVFTTQQVW